MARSLAKNKRFNAGVCRLAGELAGDVLRREKGTSAGKDVEQLHQMRTLTNRLRCAIALMGSEASLRGAKQWRGALKLLSGALSEGRDMDVALEHYDRLAVRPGSASSWRAGGSRRASGSAAKRFRPGVEWFRQSLRKRREERYAALRGFFQSREWKRLRVRLQRLARSEAGLWRKNKRGAARQPMEVFPAVMAPVMETFHERREIMLNAMEPRAAHRFRLACKQIRYVCEFFSNHLGKKGKDLAAFFKSLQDCLGETHDLEILEAQMAAALHRLMISTAPAEVTRTPGIRRLVEQSRARRVELRGVFEKLWKRLHAPSGPLRHINALIEKPRESKKPTKPQGGRRPPDGDHRVTRTR